MISARRYARLVAEKERQRLLSERESAPSTTAVGSEAAHQSNAVRVPRTSRSATHLARVPKGEAGSRSESSQPITLDYTRLNEPTLKIRLEQEGNRYIVLNATDGNTVYLRADLMPCVRFMRAFALKENALVDERSVELQLELAAARAIAWTRTRSAGEPEADSVSLAGAAAEPASPADLDLADVIPIRKAVSNGS